jgi:AcrR family transcriptional regulator
MSTPSRTPRRPLRADAERNRRLILDAARELFAARGLHVGLDEIARHAGVGVGTVYRRFPDKDVLISELFDERVEALVAGLDDAAAREDPWDAFTSFLRAFARMQAEDRGMKELLLQTGDYAGRIEEVKAQIRPRVDAIVERAQEAGVLRADLAPLDVPLVNIMLGAVADAARDIRPDVWERALALLLDALVVRRDGPTALPGRPLDDSEVQDVMRSSVPRR